MGLCSDRAPATWSSAGVDGRQGPCTEVVARFPDAVETCRSRHPYLQTSQGGVRQAEVARTSAIEFASRLHRRSLPRYDVRGNHMDEKSPTRGTARSSANSPDTEFQEVSRGRASILRATPTEMRSATTILFFRVLSRALNAHARDNVNPLKSGFMQITPGILSAT
jgi:hypothetical protein